ncbi:Fic family protein [Dyella acidiphila]|uniref:Fic family protein n=1 Tax=Dyella acidiphila TaxID=2775866 RepID=A0ABR9GEC9_9GAMM|nr:Fic family protein [Dyella acidiphila]MBE1162382.1 Fic family protein [Dyella acidiphila]
MSVEWIWQQPGWPRFVWNDETLAPLLADCRVAQGRLLGMASAISEAELKQGELNTLLQNIVTSSRIEGEQLDETAVRSSLAKRLGLAAPAQGKPSSRSEGLAEMMLDATQHYDAPLDLKRLNWWHTLLFPEEQTRLLYPRLIIGALRDGPMEVISGPDYRRKVHFVAPPEDRLQQQLASFLEWFGDSKHAGAIDSLLRAGIAHFWFVTIHPYEDGNGRITRALTDLALAQAESHAIRLYTMSASILDDRNGYYDILEHSQKSGLDITPWLSWFLHTLKTSLEQALARIGAVLVRARYWASRQALDLLPEQRRFLFRMLEDLDGDRSPAFSAKNYRAITHVTKPTATRHLQDLVKKGCIVGVDVGRGPGAKYALAL